MRGVTRGVLAALPLALALAVTLTGCGSDDGGDQVASADKGAGGDRTPSAGASLSRDEMGVKFAQCMRENGVDVPDPEPGKGVQVRVTGGPDTQESMQKAMEACRQYSPQVNGGNGADPQAAERGRKYAECMRKNGVESFPDPDPAQPGRIIINGETGQDPDLKKAQQACDSLLAGGGPSAGAGGR